MRRTLQSTLPLGFFTLFVACGPIVPLGGSRQPASATAHLDAAAVALQNKRYSEAAEELESRMAVLGRNARAWRVLGQALLRLHKSKRAEQAFTEALALDPTDARTQFYLGVSYAQEGDTERALDWFSKVRASGRFDMTELTVEDDLAPLRSNPRFLGLLPAAADFSRPFVEPVKIIHEWDGEAPEDQFGWIARVVGDVDGDGYNDFVTAAPTKNIGGENAGRVYVFSGKSGALLWSVDGAPGAQLGSGIEAAGDIDRDGIPDVIASAPEIDTAYVLSGRDGHTLRTFHGEAHGDRFGEHVSGAGDFDGDGYPDVLIGAPGNNAGGKGAGRAYLYSGRDGHLLLTLTGERAGDAFGSTVAGYSDSAHRFLVIGAPGGGPRSTGRVYVYNGLSSLPLFVIDGDRTSVALGYMFVSVVGDVDGDGVPDIFASDWSDASLGPSTGKTYIYSGRTGRRLYVWAGQTAGEGFGTTHSVAGDVNGDGRADLIIGSWQYSGTAQSAGRAYLFDGLTGHLLRTYTSRIPGETFGFDAVGYGAEDDTGQTELLITSGWSGVHGHHSGRVFLIASGVARRDNGPVRFRPH
jgi:cytochrome c-type biogenesis protein CcmH/NrfG